MQKILFECRIPKSKQKKLNKYLIWLNEQGTNKEIIINNINRYFKSKRKSKKSKIFYLVESKQKKFYLTDFKSVCLG